MLFFRSEEDVVAWCHEQGLPVRPLLSMDQLMSLADTWYRDRLTMASNRPVAEDIPLIFAAIGLEGPFWDPSSFVWSAE